MRQALFVALLLIAVLTSLAPAQNVSRREQPLTAAEEPPADSRGAVPLQTWPFWHSGELGVNSTGMIWEDCNRDGFIDVFFSNGNDIVRARNSIYLSKYGMLPSSASWLSANLDYSGHCAVGDISDNGYPDFVVSNYLGSGGFSTPNRSDLYWNNDGLPETTAGWHTADSFFSFSCALGDVDGDGDLDLAVATGESYTGVYTPDRVYLNVDGLLSTTPAWQSAHLDAALDITWGDVDRDGDLDLAVCYDGSGAMLYRNSGGVLQASPCWQSANAEPANTLVFGDIDGDQWLDLVVAFNSQLGGQGRFVMYLNNGSGDLTATPHWQSATGGYGSGVSLYDYDNDGDVDLAAGRWWDKPRLYENTGSTFTGDPVWRAEPAVVVEELAWVDIDADGVEERADTVPADGRRLFYAAHAPLYSLDSVYVDGTPLPLFGYCHDLVSGWVSLAEAPVSSAVIFYQYSFKNDLTSAHWDTCNMAWGNTNRPYVDLYGEPRMAQLPMIVQFSDSSAGASAWQWRFGDGAVSTENNPLHEYAQPGVYDVRLDLVLPDGPHNRTARGFIVALADTLWADTALVAGGQAEITVKATNTLPLDNLIVPISYSGDIDLKFVDYTTAGCRTAYFADTACLHSSETGKLLTIRLRPSADGSRPPLDPGSGAALKLRFEVASPAVPGQSTAIRLDGYGIFTPEFASSRGNYPPITAQGFVYASDCCEGTRGDVNGLDGGPDIADLVYLVNYMFKDGPEPPCFEEADVDASLELDIADAVYLVNYMFKSGPPPSPCP